MKKHLDESNAKEKAAIFKAFSEPARLRILKTLLNSKTSNMNVGQLAGSLQFSHTKTSRHLNYLRRAGIVIEKRKKREVVYMISQKPGSIAKALLNIIGT